MSFLFCKITLYVSFYVRRSVLHDIEYRKFVSDSLWVITKRISPWNLLTSRDFVFMELFPVIPVNLSEFQGESRSKAAVLDKFRGRKCKQFVPRRKEKKYDCWCGRTKDQHPHDAQEGWVKSIKYKYISNITGISLVCYVRHFHYLLCASAVYEALPVQMCSHSKVLFLRYESFFQNVISSPNRPIQSYNGFEDFVKLGTELDGEALHGKIHFESNDQLHPKFVYETNDFVRFDYLEGKALWWIDRLNKMMNIDDLSPIWKPSDGFP